MKFKLWLENEQENKIKKLGDQLKNLDLQKYSVLGHGTPNVNTAKNIMKTGLRYSDPDLDRQAVPLFDSKVPIQDQPENLNLILNWTHRNSRAVVIIAIPNPVERKGSPSHYFQAVWDQIPDDELTDFYGRPSPLNTFKYIIKPEYIAGYVDADTATFHPNPKFKPSQPQTKDKWWANPPDFRQHIPSPDPIAVPSPSKDDTPVASDTDSLSTW